MDDEERPWSWQDDIPDGTSLEQILDDLRWLSRKSAIHSLNDLGILEMMLLNPEMGGVERESALLKLVISSKEHAKVLSIFLDRISEYIRRMNDRNSTD